jgi:Zn finger protein HypA/HybF involved in hydrogenase expression
MSRGAVKGTVYRCPICGAEAAIIRMGAEPAPRCCNEPMELAPAVNAVYRCPLCSSEVMVIAHGKRLEPRCCNRAMIRDN